MEREDRKVERKNINLLVPFDFKNDLKLTQKNRFVSLKQVNLDFGKVAAKKRFGSKIGNKSNPKKSKMRNFGEDETGAKITSLANFSFGDQQKNKKRFSQMLKLNKQKIQKSRNPEKRGFSGQNWKGPRRKKCRSTKISRANTIGGNGHFFRDAFLDSSFDESCKSEKMGNGSWLNLKETVIGSSDVTLKENLRHGGQMKGKMEAKKGVCVDENKTIKRRPERRKLARVSRSKSQNETKNMRKFKEYFLQLPEDKKLGKKEILEIINHYF